MRFFDSLRAVVLRVALAAVTVFAVFALAADGAAHEADGKPARIHQGTCEVLGGVAYQLTGVGATVGLDGAELPEPEIAGAPSAAPVLLSVTTVEAALDDIVAGGHAIAIYESDEAMDVMVACGDVGGPQLDDALVVGLRELSGSGHSGIAVLRPDGTGTSVTIYLGEGLSAGAAPADDHSEGTPPA